MFDFDIGQKFETEPSILINSVQSSIEGDFTGSIITKLKPPRNDIIFSDKIKITSSELLISGLHVGIKDNQAYSINKDTHFQNSFEKVDYCVKLPHELLRQFDEGRFSATYPNIVRYLTTKILFYKTLDIEINHLEFVAGEILNRPIVLKNDSGIIIADRLVVDEHDLTPIFYDGIIIQRNELGEVQIAYEPLIRITIDQIGYILLLGAENF